MAHAVFLMYMAYLEFNFIYDTILNYADKRGGVENITNVDGIRCLLFGIMIGVGGYLSGASLGTSSDNIL